MYLEIRDREIRFKAQDIFDVSVLIWKWKGQVTKDDDFWKWDSPWLIASKKMGMLFLQPQGLNSSDMTEL